MLGVCQRPPLSHLTVAAHEWVKVVSGSPCLNQLLLSGKRLSGCYTTFRSDFRVAFKALHSKQCRFLKRVVEIKTACGGRNGPTNDDPHCPGFIRALCCCQRCRIQTKPQAARVLMQFVQIVYSKGRSSQSTRERERGRRGERKGDVTWQSGTDTAHHHLPAGWKFSRRNELWLIDRQLNQSLNASCWCHHHLAPAHYYHWFLQGNMSKRSNALFIVWCSKCNVTHGRGGESPKDLTRCPQHDDAVLHVKCIPKKYWK